MWLLVFTLTGLALGLVVSALIQAYFHWGIKDKHPKSPLHVFMWGGYVGLVFIGAVVASSYLEDPRMLGKLDETARVIFTFLWIFPVTITGTISLLRIFNRQNEAVSNGASPQSLGESQIAEKWQRRRYLVYASWIGSGIVVAYLCLTPVFLMPNVFWRNLAVGIQTLISIGLLIGFVNTIRLESRCPQCDNYMNLLSFGEKYSTAFQCSKCGFRWKQ